MLALVAAAPAESGVHHVRTADQFNATVERIGNRAGTIVLRPGRYGTLHIGRRSPTARWLTVRAKPEALTKRVELRGARRVNLLGLRVRPYWGAHALVLLRWSRQVNIARLTLRGAGRQMGRIRVRHSRNVILRDSDLSRCVVICLRADDSARVGVFGNAFHDCYGCDFFVAIRVNDVVLRSNTFDRALPSSCGVGGVCNHQDLVQMVGGRRWLLERNRFGLAYGGAAQVYLSGQFPTDDVTVRGNVFLRSDPTVPGLVSDTGLIVGQPPETGHHGLPTRVVIAGNTILSGASRDIQGGWIRVANSLILSEEYVTIAPELRPLVVNNVLARMNRPDLVCGSAQASGYNLYADATPCSELDLTGDPLVDEAGYPLEGSPLVGRAEPSWATAVDFTGQPRDDQPDIGAFEWRP